MTQGKELFTDEEYAKSDPMWREGTTEESVNHMAMKNMQFAIDHDHATDSIQLIQRYEKQFVDEDGFTAPEPQQITMTIPMAFMEIVMLELLEGAMCLSTKKIEGKGH